MDAAERDLVSKVFERALSPKEAAAVAGVHLATIYRWLEKDLPHFSTPTGGTVCVMRDDLQDYLARRHTVPLAVPEGSQAVEFMEVTSA